MDEIPKNYDESIASIVPKEKINPSARIEQEINTIMASFDHIISDETSLEDKREVFESMQRAVDEYFLPKIVDLVECNEKREKSTIDLQKFYSKMHSLAERLNLTNKLSNVRWEYVTRSGRSDGRSATDNLNELKQQMDQDGFAPVITLENFSRSGSSVGELFLRKNSGFNGLKDFSLKDNLAITAVENPSFIDLYIQPGYAGHIIGSKGSRINEISRILGISKRIVVKEIQPETTSKLYIKPQSSGTGDRRNKFNIIYANIPTCNINNETIIIPPANLKDSKSDDDNMKNLPNIITLEDLNMLLSMSLDEIENHKGIIRDQDGSSLMYSLIYLWENKNLQQMLLKQLKFEKQDYIVK